MTLKKTTMTHIILIAIFCLTMGASIVFAEENNDDFNVGCDGDSEFYNEHSFGEDMDEGQTPLIGATSYSNSDCQRKYGSMYKACGSKCYHTGYATCMNSRVSLVCSKGMKGCPYNQPTSCYRSPCQCRSGRVSCN